MSFCSCGVAGCVTHLYVRNFIKQMSEPRFSPDFSDYSDCLKSHSHVTQINKSNKAEIVVQTTYSVRNDFTGLATAAFIAWRPTVSKAIINTPTPAKANIHQLIFIL